MRKLRGWLDAEDQAPAGDVRLLRVLKVGEEFGEAAEAITEALGANSRKGTATPGRTSQRSCATSS
ncbi:hypothetical protein GCM10023329_25640 [Streptomyces sanyensis]|uniref:Uncharacterized protein n=1 Tax=Streptomyces sanyensis TaxID=568869 RepID=A0ABP9A7J6_9ACTN